MWNTEKKEISLRKLIATAPKSLNKEYLQKLYLALHNEKLEHSSDVDALINSLLLLLIDHKTSVLAHHFASVILHKISPIPGVAEVLSVESGSSVKNVLPVLFSQFIYDSGPGIEDVIRKAYWLLCSKKLDSTYQGILICFLSKVFASSKCPLPQDDIRRILVSLPHSIMSDVLIPSPDSLYKKSSFALSDITADMKDVFGLLDSGTHQYSTRNNHIFSCLQSFLFPKNQQNRSMKQLCPVDNDLTSEEFTYLIKEYCIQIIVSTTISAQSQSVAEFQKACLVEAVGLLNIICFHDSGAVHSVYPAVKRLYDNTSSILQGAEVQDVAILTCCMQFFINHGSSVMHKPDNLYRYLFCDLLGKCYQDNYVSFEILHLVKENLSQLCYHSSVLEKYFPTFFKVLAWRPITFITEFVELLPAFMSQQTSHEVFYTLLDLPCLTAVLIVTDDSLPPSMKDPTLLETLRSPEFVAMFKFMLRKSSGIADTFHKVKALHEALQPLTSHGRVEACASVVLPLLKCYFSIFLKFADVSLTVWLLPAILQRLSVIFSVPQYLKQMQKLFSTAVIQLLQLHPEAIFHCQKDILGYTSHLRNYYDSKDTFINLVWAIGEYVSVTYSHSCRPELIATFFESLECTTYEILSSLNTNSDEQFLKLLCVCFMTLSKLAARNQDQVPRAILCLSKAHHQIFSYEMTNNPSWKITMERILELLSILNSPNTAAVVLSSPKHMERGKFHNDPTALPFVLRTVDEMFSDKK